VSIVKNFFQFVTNFLLSVTVTEAKWPRAFVPANPIKPGLTFASKVRQSLLLSWSIPCLRERYHTKLEMLAKDKRSSLIGLFIVEEAEESFKH
jgi:hypothetical protein